MNIRTLYEATAREHLRDNGIYPPTEARMTFDEWWLLQNPEHLDELTAKEVWAVATAAERERCARIAEGAQREYDNRMPDDDDKIDRWADRIMGNREELADVLEEHYTRPIADYLAYRMTDGFRMPPAHELIHLIHAARAEVETLVYAHCRKELNEPTSAQMDACDDREAGR